MFRQRWSEHRRANEGHAGNNVCTLRQAAGGQQHDVGAIADGDRSKDVLCMMVLKSHRRLRPVAAVRQDALRPLHHMSPRHRTRSSGYACERTNSGTALSLLAALAAKPPCALDTGTDQARLRVKGRFRAHSGTLPLRPSDVLVTCIMRGYT